MNEGKPQGQGPDLYGRPTAGELVEAVREFLERDVAPQLDGAVRYHLRVAVNALAIVGRELALGDAARSAHSERLERLGVADDADLAEAIRRGDYDDRWGEVVALVSEAVADKLAVSNPRWA